MSDSDQALAGVQSCGCITYVTSRPDDLDRHDEKAITEIVRNGGTVRRATVGEIKADPDFLPRECPHDPKGWEYTPPEPFAPSARCKSTYRPGIKRVAVKIHEWGKHNFHAGEVCKREGAWWATTGWFDAKGVTANNGDEPREPVEVLGPFKLQRDAAAALIPMAVEKADRYRRAAA